VANLDLAAIQLLEAGLGEIRSQASHTEKQLAFFEIPKPAKRKQGAD
jgi:hypothetical protein